MSGENGWLYIVERRKNTGERYDPGTRSDRVLWKDVWALAENPEPEACARFADRWGLLLRKTEYEQATRTDFHAGQQHRLWKHQLRRFRLGVELFRALSTGKWSRFERFEITAEPNGKYFAVAELERSENRNDAFVAPTRRRASRADCARALLQNYADVALLSETYIRRSLEGGLEGVAASPLGVAWVELLEEAATRSGAECEWCGSWFTYDPRNPRGQKYCPETTRCRVAAHRRRHAADPPRGIKVPQSRR